MNAFVWVGLSAELGILVYLAVYFGTYLEKQHNQPQATATLLIVFFLVWIVQLIFLIKKWQK